MRTIKTLLLLLAIISTCANAISNPILTAAEGVQRVWLGKLLSASELVAIGNNIELEKKVRKNGFVSIPTKKGELTIFQDKNELYMMVGHGSSFFVTTNHVVTNHHVIESTLNSDQIKAFLVTKLAPELKINPVSVLWSNKNKDLAVISVENIKGAVLSLADGDFIIQTLSVTSVGFPGTSDEISGGTADRQGYVTPKTKDGSLSGASINPKTGVHSWEHNAAISGGSSGGALVNDCGQVVGINVAGHKLAQQTLLAIAIEELIPALKNLNISYKQSKGKCITVNQGIWNKPWFPVLLGLMLLAIVIYLMVLKRQQGIAGSTFTPSRLISEVMKKMVGGEPQVKNKYEWLIDDHGRKYRTDPILGIIYKADDSESKSKEKEKSEQVTDEQFVMVTVQGQDQGALKLYSGKTIIVGRSAKCDITLSNKYVTNQHLKLTYDGYSVKVTDLGSENGSYHDGEKITEINVTQNTDIQLAALNSLDRLIISFSSEDAKNPESQRVIAVLKPISDSNLPEVVLKENQLVSIGSDKNNTVIITNKYISSQHCLLRAHSDGTIILEDNHSKNGTFIDGFENRISKQHISVGQKICLAVKEVVYQVH